MKKLILIISISLLFSIAGKSNPIHPPFHGMSELKVYEDSTKWELELCFKDDWESWADSLNEFFLVFLDDTAYFNSNQPIIHGEVLLVGIEDLSDPLYLDNDGGTLKLCFIHIITIDISEIRYGEPYFLYVPDETQSIARLHNGFWGLENNPSMGQSPYYNSTRISSLSGHVYDALGKGIPDLKVYAYGIRYTNSEGYFNFSNLPLKRYELSIYDTTPCPSIKLCQDTISPQIDSINYYEYHFDTIYVNREEITIDKQPQLTLSAYPNPFSSNVNIRITSNKPLRQDAVYVKLFDLSGQLIRLERINSPYITEVEMSWDLSGLSSGNGTYLLVLEGDDGLVASQKLVYQK